MRATWQDPAAAWDDPVQSSTTNAQVEVSSEPTMAASASIIKCIALYSYTVRAHSVDIALYSFDAVHSLSGAGAKCR